MTSSVTTINQDGENVEVKENTAVTTIQRIYRGNDEDIVVRDPNNRRSFINRPAYVKLHRSFSSGSKRHSVDNLKGRFENLARENSRNEDKNPNSDITDGTKQKESISDLPPEQIEKEATSVPSPTEPIEGETKFTPASFGYPKTAKLVPPLIKPKPPIRKRTPKDENSNVVSRNSQVSDVEEVQIVLQPTASVESVDKIAKELSNFTMDGKPKKRGSFRKLFLGSFFTKDKKKKEEERNKSKYGDNIVYNDNMRNESNFSRQSPQRQTLPKQNVPVISHNDQAPRQQEIHEEQVRALELRYAELHTSNFRQIRQTFNDDKSENYVIMDNSKTKPKPTISDFISTPVKYIDTSSSTSTESEKPNGVVPRDTPPRAQETYQNIKVVKPKAAVPISSERSLPNPYQTDKTSPRTIERNLNKSNSKDYPDKPSFSPNHDDTYGTVFDSLEYVASRNGDAKPINARPPPNSPRALSLESTKLKLPPNREIYEPQPRVKSPIPINRVSTEKIIATELLKSTRSPTPPKRTVSKLTEEVASKPPMSPKSPRKYEPQTDKIVTNAMVHTPIRAETPLETNYRVSTPIDLRMSVSQKMSPQKGDIRKSVEEYYWKELKKLKEEEDSKLYSMQVNGYYDEAARVRRSRSLSPSSHKVGRRSLSLPREGKGPVYIDYVRVAPSIPEDQALTTDGRTRHFVYDQNFIRNNPERRSVDSLQRPIFRRGSLNKQENYEGQPYNKKVSFSNSQAHQAWPSRNGFVQNPPQRRLERLESEVEDEVFLQSPNEPIYGTRYAVQNEPVYGTNNRILQQFRAQQYDSMRRQAGYGQVPQQLMGTRRLSMDSIPRQEVYVSRNQVVRRPVSNVPDDYGRGNFQQYPSNSQLSLQQNPVYSSRQSMTDGNYGQKQVSVRTRYCDIYGQIHDTPQTGVVMGQLQNNQMVPRQPDNFVRGSRLTASANDIGNRYVDPYGYHTKFNYAKRSMNYDNRPLPPPPSKSGGNPQISDTESGSDASEIQRIMQNKTKSKKRGFFGK